MLFVFRFFSIATLYALYSVALSNNGNIEQPREKRTAEQQVQLVQIYRSFVQDLFAAGLNEEHEDTLRQRNLNRIATDRFPVEKLLVHFQSTWLEIERDADKAKRQMICQQEVLDADITTRAYVADHRRDLEKSIYEKHMILTLADLRARYDVNLESALLKYAERAAVPAVFQGRRAQIVPKHGYTVEEVIEIQLSDFVENFCNTPWEFVFNLPQPDGTNKSYKITLEGLVLAQ